MGVKVKNHEIDALRLFFKFIVMKKDNLTGEVIILKLFYYYYVSKSKFWLLKQSQKKIPYF